MYAKAFGQINVQGQDSIYSFDTYSGTINSNVQIVGSGVIDITTVSNTNKIEFYSPDNGTSSMSTVVANFTSLNNGLSNKIAAFNSPFSTFIYDAISSYSTVQGPLVVFPELYSTISSFSTSIGQAVRFNELQSTLSSYSTVQGPLVTFPQLFSTISSFSTLTGQTVRYNELQSSLSSFSTVLGQTIRVPEVYSTISSFSTALGPVITMSQILSTMSSISSARIVDITNAISSLSTSMGPVITGLTLLSSLSTTNTVAQLNIGNLTVSTFNMLGSRQPYIQYGSNTLTSNGNMILSLPKSYINSNYIVQLTYFQLDTTLSNIIPLYSSNASVSNVAIYGTANSIFHWTTYGNLF
jgi:hypothetical protein